MSATLRPASPAACPACVAGPVEVPQAPPSEGRIILSLPTIHCPACISKVERGLEAQPGVRTARVNMTLKRATIDAEPTLSAADLVAMTEALGYEAHELDPEALAATETDRRGRDLLMRLAVAGFASMNVMLLSVSVWSGAEAATRDMFHWISAAISIPAIAFSAQPFFANALTALRHGRLNMDVPISLAIVLAVVTSLWETALSGEHAYFDAALALTFFLLAGRYLDYRTRSAARSAAEELTALEVPRAWRVTDTGEEDVPIAALKIGDLVRIRPGARVPVDGEVVEGMSELDRSILTGETLPCVIAAGQSVAAGELNLTGPLLIRATAVGRDTSLHRMADLVAIAESGRARYTPLADKAAKLYAPGVHILSALSFVGWYLYSGDLRTALNIAAAVLIITCPCALGLAVPAVTTAASGRLFRKGLLIKHETALERLATVDVVVFDKTGTLTTNQPRPDNLSTLPPDMAGVVLALAQSSAHPLSQALTQALRGQGVAPADVSGITEMPGCGTSGLWQGQEVRLGRADWVGTPAKATTATYFGAGDRGCFALTFEDDLRAGAEATVAQLLRDGRQVVLLSGDTEPTVQAMAVRLGIDDWSANARPEDKVARITELKAAGKQVLMVGDGLNDTAALCAADVSISPATALDAARVASDIVLLGTDLEPITAAITTAQSATRRIRENFRIATVYNVIAVPLAVIGLATPLIAALAMSASSITVSLNALRLR